MFPIVGMTAMAIMAGLQAALGIGQSIAAGSKRRKAEQFFEKNKYEVPSGVKSMLDVVKGVASQTKMPGYENYLQQLQGTTSQGVEAATRSGQSSSDVLGALQGLYGRQMGMQQDLAISNAQDWQRNQFQYANALQTMGQYQTEKWNYNVLYPYMQKMTGAGQMAEAGGQNIGSAINSGINILGANWQMKNDELAYQDWKYSKGIPRDMTPLQTTQMWGAQNQLNTTRKQLPTPNVFNPGVISQRSGFMPMPAPTYGNYEPYNPNSGFPFSPYK